MLRKRLACLATCLLLVAFSSSQITFSRDWVGGKRAENPTLKIDCHQLSRICDHFIHDLKQAITFTCELKPSRKNKNHNYKSENSLDYYNHDFDDST